MLGGVADDRDDHGGDEEVGETDLLGEHLQRADQDLRNEGGGHGGDAQYGERAAERPGLDVLIARDVEHPMAAEGVDRDDDVDEQECDGDGYGQDCEVVPVGITLPARDGGDEEEERRERDAAIATKLEKRSSSPRPPSDEREAEHEEQVPDHAPCERPANDFGEPLVDRDQSDDQLGGVAEGRVEEAADTGARVLGGVIRCLSDQPGKRDERERGEHELRYLVGVGEVVERDRDRRERERSEEEPTGHGGQALPGRSGVRGSTACAGRTLAGKHLRRRDVKSCAPRLRGATSGHERQQQPTFRSVPRTRWSADAARSTATRSCTRARASSMRVRSCTRTRPRATRTWAACRRCSRSRSISTCCARRSAAARGSAVCGPGARPCRCARSRSPPATSTASDEAGCRNPEFFEVPRASPSYRVFAVLDDVRG